MMSCNYEFEIMKLNIISISFVGVYSKPQTRIPTLENKFCKDLFNQPYETFNGLSPDGFTVVINGKPFPLLVINPQKIIFKAKDKDNLSKYINAVKAELAKINFSTDYSAFGINWEIQWIDLPSSADMWLWNRFVGDNIKTDSRFQSCNAISMRYGVNDSEEFNISFEPRAGIRNGIFCSVNHHHVYSLENLPNDDELGEMIKNSEDLLFNKYIPLIIGE